MAVSGLQILFRQNFPKLKRFRDKEGEASQLSTVNCWVREHVALFPVLNTPHLQLIRKR
jgi:hypothetical protein